MNLSTFRHSIHSLDHKPNALRLAIVEWLLRCQDLNQAQLETSKSGDATHTHTHRHLPQQMDKRLAVVF